MIEPEQYALTKTGNTKHLRGGGVMTHCGYRAVRLVEARSPVARRRKMCRQCAVMSPPPVVPPRPVSRGRRR